jgi:uncharacterized membrane protein YccC
MLPTDMPHVRQPMSTLPVIRLFYRLPDYVINGLTVAIGIGLVQLLFGSLTSLHWAQMAASGAVLTSLSDLPNTPARSRQRVLTAALLGPLWCFLIASFDPHPWLLGLVVMAVVFSGMMALSWGPRAGPLSFTAVLAIVFSMGVPAGQSPSELLLLNLLGALAYFAWSQLAVQVLQRRFRSLALAKSLEALAQLLRSRASVLEGSQEPDDSANALSTWIRDEALLAERLQKARDMLFAAPDTARARQESAVLLNVIDLRDVLLASRLDLELLGSDATAREIRTHLGEHLRIIAQGLDAARDRLSGPGLPAAPPPNSPARDATSQLDALLIRIAEGLVGSSDPRLRLVPALVDRLRHLDQNLERIQALLLDTNATLPLTTQELTLFVAPEGWPLAALRSNLTLASPVMRHALRSALAMGCAYFLALPLPWAAHPQWLVLSVAVVLRGNLEQTLSRRNMRVMGTLLGCLAVLLIAPIGSVHVLMLLFLLAVATGHSFVNERYLVTASAATVMALLQAHLMHPGTGFAITERLADTVLGAIMAWGFCFVLPSWERRALPRALPRMMQALRDYAHGALRPDNPSTARQDSVTERLARSRAYDALGVLATALQRSSVEPKSVQLPVRELTALLDHCQRLMAHLSMVRLTRLNQGAELQVPQATQALELADQTLQALLDPNPAAKQPTPTPDDTTALELLPSEPPHVDVLPWLLRRLRVTVQDAEHVAQAKALVVAALKAQRDQRALARRST